MSRLLRTAIVLAALGLAGRRMEAQVTRPTEPWPAFARFEIAVLGGYRFESTLSFREPVRYDRVEIDNAPTFGVTAGYNLNPYLGTELQYSYASVGATAIAVDPANPNRSFFVGMHDFQLGLYVYLAEPEETVRPFLELAIGATALNSDQNLDEQVQLSLGVSLGLKAYLSDHVGVRAEVHYVPVFLYGTGNGAWVCFDDFCWDTGGRYLQQVDLRAGVTFRF